MGHLKSNCKVPKIKNIPCCLNIWIWLWIFPTQIKIIFEEQKNPWNSFLTLFHLLTWKLGKKKCKTSSSEICTKGKKTSCNTLNGFIGNWPRSKWNVLRWLLKYSRNSSFLSQNDNTCSHQFRLPTVTFRILHLLVIFKNVTIFVVWLSKW